LHFSEFGKDASFFIFSCPGNDGVTVPH